MKLTAYILLGLIALSVLLFGIRQCNTASNVAFKQTNAETVLIRYEWFKDAHNQLNAKLANIQTQEAVVKIMELRYAGIKATEWQRADVDSYTNANAALAGIKMSYNNLAAEYNSNMSKVNYVYCKPTDGSAALPKEFIAK